MLAGAEDEEIQGGVELESGPQKAGTGVRRVEVKKGQSSGQPEIEVGLGGEEPSVKKYLLEKGMKGREEDGPNSTSFGLTFYTFSRFFNWHQQVGWVL